MLDQRTFGSGRDESISAHTLILQITVNKIA